VGKADHFRTPPEFAQRYQNCTRYGLIVPDKEHNSKTGFFGRTMLDWESFLPRPISIAKTSLLQNKPRGDDDDSEESSEEEEGEIR